MHSIEVIASFVSRKLYLVRTIVYPSTPKLKDQARYLHHICQFIWRKDEDVLQAPKQEERTEHLLCVHYVMQPFGFKKKETVNNITHKPAVTNILKTLLEHEFHDVKILITQDIIRLLWLKNLLSFIQALLMYHIKIDYMRKSLNFFSTYQPAGYLPRLNS